MHMLTPRAKHWWVLAVTNVLLEQVERLVGEILYQFVR